MPTITKKKTKMIVKDGNGGLLQLLPETEVDAELDEESSNPVASSAVAESLSSIQSAASNMGAIKVMDEEPTALNTTEYTGETLIAWMQPEMPSWSITINTELAGDSEKTGQIPFCLYEAQNAAMTVDWGDGTVETYTSTNAVENSCPTHQYANVGEYTIKMESDDFNRLYLWTSSSLDEEEKIKYYIITLKSINEPLPQIAGVHVWRYNEDTEEEGIEGIDNSFYCCFRNCEGLQSIPVGLFDKNTAVTDFDRCFQNCFSLTSIPSGLFDKNTAVTSFEGCFYRCTSLTSIPSGLFDKNTAVTDFASCFTGCSSLQSIPEGLFDNNTLVTNFYYCFSGCSSIQSIPEGLFDKNTAATDFSYCFEYCTSLADFTLYIGSSSVSSCSSFVTRESSTTRTIYVPSGSTTQTTFNSYALFLGLTIIGE